MSLQIQTKKSLVLISFILLSFIFVGIVYSLTNDVAVRVDQSLEYPSWLVIAYLAGLSMIILPCTLPLVFVIVPMSMGQSCKKGLFMALLFGAGLTIMITSYGIGVSALGKTASLDQVSFLMFLIAGIAAFAFGLSQLKIISIKLPTYSGTPQFIQKRGDYTKSFLMGILLGNAGVGCPNPMFYWLLIYIAGTGSFEIGASLGAVHGIGRAIPLILLSILAIIGINATKSITLNRIKIENVTGWMLIVLGAFLIINGLPGGHQWYESAIVHIDWNNAVSMAGLPVEFHMGQHIHESVYGFALPQNTIPVLMITLMVTPIALYIIKKKKEVIS
ncbi:MAG: cytochrome C biogenesis protein [Nitrosopumilaceae archaeon]|nr:cytochrome C biogenesis protein [Nitrosopumilaceae archaeon]NIU00032.1 cytochrome C biogenesis protein [Nitrosopumilaceae archaeon]NIU86410.1 cytochrome C biogenesis protein [Nitrosopumilaceae archaeon]NIV65120.1 cytochrome C biogenesis protein [Nitrosopumilaceae archaeon]NIX60634.1 cytochrome C biogenesis protein [Nitrosopumilaceae archaeon]